MNLGGREKAVSLYENALLVNPDNPVIQKELAMLYKESIAEAGERKTVH